MPYGGGSAKPGIPDPGLRVAAQSRGRDLLCRLAPQDAVDRAAAAELRALWPAPLLCRWSLNARHGAHGYEDAKGLYDPFDQLLDPDPLTRGTLAKVIAATTGAGLPVYITVNNKAERSAPLSIIELARSVERETLQKPASYLTKATI